MGNDRAAMLRDPNQPPDRGCLLDREIGQFLSRSVCAWNAGVLGDFMSCYENSTATTYMTPREVLVGYDAIRNMYAARFADPDFARKDALSVRLEQATSLGPGYALARGFYRLQGKTVSAGQPTGMFSLVLRAAASGWLILVDHTF